MNLHCLVPPALYRDTCFIFGDIKVSIQCGSCDVLRYVNFLEYCKCFKYFGVKPITDIFSTDNPDVYCCGCKRWCLFLFSEVKTGVILAYSVVHKGLIPGVCSISNFNARSSDLFKSCFKILLESLYLLFSGITVVVGLHPDYNLEVFEDFLFNLGFIFHSSIQHSHKVGIKRLAEGDIAHNLNSKALQKLGASSYNDLGKIGKTNVTLLTEDILYDYCYHVKYYEDTRPYLRSWK